jgi:serine/threonine protein kinase/tetratricopeptide (TPR) repeat protein
LLREARAASKLNHKNILTIYAVESAEGRDFIVMEYIDGRSLKDLIDAREPVPVEQIIRIALHICDGLSAAHEQGIVHRDIKPANILITAKGQVKITDFGLATWRGAGQLTKEGTTVGTAAYMSPEQIQGRSVDPRSDLFALGVMLYELLAGRRPFAGEHDAAITYAIINDIPEPLARFKSGLHPGLEQVVARALEKDPGTRYQTATDMLAELKRIRREIEGSQPSMLSRTMATPPRRSYLRYVFAASAVAAVALLFFVFKPFKFDVDSDQPANASENSLAIMYFDNVADPADTDKIAQMTTGLLITDLSESQYIKVVSRQRLYDLLKQLGHEGETRIDQNTATEIARRAGVRYILTGEIYQSSPRLVIASQISEVARGEVVSSQKITGSEGEDIFAVVDRLSSAVRADLSLPAQASAEPDRPVAEMTSRSADAYRHLLEGIDYSRKLYHSEAAASLKKALEYDSTLAMAYFYLSLTDVFDRRAVWLEQGMRHIDRAGWRDARMIRARYAETNGDVATALNDLGEIIARDPNDKEALFSRGYLYRFRLREHRKALQDFLRIVEIDPSDKIAYNLLAYGYQDVGDIENSLKAINQYIALAPDEANPYDTRGDLHAHAGQVEQAIASYRRALQIKPDFPTLDKLGALLVQLGRFAEADSLFQTAIALPNVERRSFGRAGLALSPLRQGDFDRADEIARQGMAADEMDRYEGAAYREKLVIRVAIDQQRRNFEKALRGAEELHRMIRQQQPADADAALDWMVEIRAQAGDFDGARSTLEQLQAALKGRPLEDSAALAFAQGVLEFWQGNYAAATPHLARADSISDAFFYALMLGRAYLQNGQLDRAVGVLEDRLRSFDEERIFNPFGSTLIHYYLAQAYERSGWSQKAAEEYEKFLGLWHKADPDLAEIADARARLMKLRS